MHRKWQTSTAYTCLVRSCLRNSSCVCNWLQWASPFPASQILSAFCFICFFLFSFGVFHFLLQCVCLHRTHCTNDSITGIEACQIETTASQYSYLSMLYGCCNLFDLATLHGQWMHIASRVLLFFLFSDLFDQTNERLGNHFNNWLP